MKFLIAVTCLTLSVIASADTAKLRVKSYTDYLNSNRDLSTPKIFLVDIAFAKKNYLEFYMFEKGEDEVCFTGPAREAAKIISVILNASTGDAYVYPGKAKITTSLITQDVRFEDEGGEHEFTVSVSSCR